jgi:hypothetical protein
MFEWRKWLISYYFIQKTKILFTLTTKISEQNKTQKILHCPKQFKNLIQKLWIETKLIPFWQIYVTTNSPGLVQVVQSDRVKLVLCAQPLPPLLEKRIDYIIIRRIVMTWSSDTFYNWCVIKMILKI